jgi:hypothetical protein
MAVAAALISAFISVSRSTPLNPKTKPGDQSPKFFFSHRISDITLIAKSFRTALIPSLAQYE